MRIFGIDPGTRVVGFGVIDDARRAPLLVGAGSLRANARWPLPRRLCALHDELVARLEEHRPDVVAIESAFYGRNVASLIGLGEGRGVALFCAARRELPIFEYAPSEVKKAVTGTGGARKEQVADMVKSILGVVEIGGGNDATDALAIALCHSQRRRLPVVDGSELLGAGRGRRSSRRRGRGR